MLRRTPMVWRGTLHSGEEGKCEKGAPVTCQPRLIFPSCFQPASRHARPQLDPDWLSLALPASDWLQRVITALPLYGCYCTASNEEWLKMVIEKGFTEEGFANYNRSWGSTRLKTKKKQRIFNFLIKNQRRAHLCLMPSIIFRFAPSFFAPWLCGGFKNAPLFAERPRQ